MTLDKWMAEAYVDTKKWITLENWSPRSGQNDPFVCRLVHCIYPTYVSFGAISEEIDIVGCNIQQTSGGGGGDGKEAVFKLVK